MNFKHGQHINQLDDPVNLTFELEMLKSLQLFSLLLCSPNETFKKLEQSYQRVGCGDLDHMILQIYRMFA